MTNFQQLIEHFDRQELLEAKRMMQETTKEASEMAASIHKKHGVWTVLTWKEAA